MDASWQRTRQGVSWLIVVLLPGLSWANPAALPGNAETMGLVSHTVGDQVELGCDRFRLRFSADGKPLSLRLVPEGSELLVTGDPGPGFVVVNRAGEQLPMRRLSLDGSGRQLRVSTGEEGQEVVFRLRPGPAHLGFQVEKLVRFSPAPDLTLQFRMNVRQGIQAIPHNYMVKVKSRPVSVVWPILWNTFRGDDPGGFTLYYGNTPEERDEALLWIWATQPIAHPKVEGAWTYARAKEWMQGWQREFVPHRGTISLEADALGDLYKGLTAAEAAGVSEVYLMPWVWRGEYWPVEKPNDGINTKMFPGGEGDLRAFSNEVRKRGMVLGFHWVSAGIGFKDPRYIGQKPDRRLASWGAGSLSSAIDEKDSEIRFRPAAGVFAPYHVSELSRSAEFLPALYSFQDYNILRVDDELIRFGSLKDTDQAVWTMTRCERGIGSTKAVAHSLGTEAAGLIASYGQNFVPDNWSTLLPEVAGNYARLMNRIGVSHAEFDGLEIHGYNGGDGLKMAELLYRELDHQTMAGSSSGQPPASWFEYRFSRSRECEAGGAIIRLRSSSQNASSILMADFGLSLAAIQGSTRLGVGSGDRGFRPAVLDKHGLGRSILARVKMWREIALAISPEDRERFNLGSIRHPDQGLGQAGGHREASAVYVPECSENGWTLTPTVVMDKGAENSCWYVGQENGPIEPWRFTKANEAGDYTNPYPEQPLRFVLHVLAATDYGSPSNCVIPLSSGVMKQVGDTRFSDDANALRLSLQNPRDKEVWDESLPVVNQKVPGDWSDHRPIGLFVEGDGRNEVLVLQMRSGMWRDYAIPISFSGRRYIEIPHGEAAYALKAWGWRFASSKGFDYKGVNMLTLGLGYCPARSSVDIRVSGLKALKEIRMPLNDPTFVTARGKLQIKGEIPFDHYLEYQGGTVASLCDANWNKVADLPAISDAPVTVPRGTSAITVKTSREGPAPWLEVQFLARGTPVFVKRK